MAAANDPQDSSSEGEDNMPLAQLILPQAASAADGDQRCNVEKGILLLKIPITLVLVLISHLQ